MTQEIENLIQQIENETELGANTKVRISNILRKIAQDNDAIDLINNGSGKNITISLVVNEDGLSSEGGLFTTSDADGNTVQISPFGMVVNDGENPVNQTSYFKDIIKSDDGVMGTYLAFSKPFTQNAFPKVPNKSGDLAIEYDYVAIISQSGTNAPTVVEKVNNLGFTPNFIYYGAGNYGVDANGVNGKFPLASMDIEITQKFQSVGFQSFITHDNNNYFGIRTLNYNTNSFTNDVLYKAILKIKKW